MVERIFAEHTLTACFVEHDHPFCVCAEVFIPFNTTPGDTLETQGVRMARAKSEFKLQSVADITVRPLKFEVSPAVAYYDLEKLATVASLELEVGSYKPEGHCPRTVMAIIRKGMVSGLRIAGCEDCGKPAPELAKLLNKAVGASGKPPKWRPVTVADFFAQPDLIIQGTGPSTGCYVVIEKLPDGRTFVSACCPDETGRLACATMIYREP